MKSFLKLLCAGLLAIPFTVSDSEAQVSTRTNNVVLVGDDGELTLTYEGAGNTTMALDDGPQIPDGTSVGQMLVWDGDEWLPYSNMSNDGMNVTLNGNLSVFGMISGDGSNITNLNALQVTGTLNDWNIPLDIPRLTGGFLSEYVIPSNFARTDASFTTFSGLVSAPGFSGDGSNLYSLNAANLFGTLSDWVIPSDIPRLTGGFLSEYVIPTNFARTNAPFTSFSGLVSAASFSGDGSNLYSLNAANLSGTLNDWVIPSNIPRLTGGVLSEYVIPMNFARTDASFTSFLGSVSASSYYGDGSNITNLNASLIAYGALALDRINTSGATQDQVLTFNGSSLVFADLPGGGGGLSFPFSETAAHDEPMFELINTSTTGTARAAYFGIDNIAATGHALVASTNGTLGSAIYATAVSTDGGRFISTTGSGVRGESTDGRGGYFISTNGPGVMAISTANVAGQFSSSSGTGVAGSSTDNSGGSFSSAYGYGIDVSSTANIAANINAYGSSNAIRATSASGIGGNFIANGAGDGVSATSVDGYGVSAYSITNTGLSARTDGDNKYAGSFYSTGANGGGIEIASGTGGIALRVHSGRMVGSYASVTSGSLLPSDVIVVHVQNNNDGGTAATATMPTAVNNGQMLYISTSDPQGVTINGTTYPVNQIRQWIVIEGTWRTIS